MFGVDPVVLLIVVLAAVSAAAVCYGILYSRIETQKKADSRVNRIKSAETDRMKVKAARDRVQEMSKRRKSVQDSAEGSGKAPVGEYQEKAVAEGTAWTGRPVADARTFLSFRRAVRSFRHACSLPARCAASPSWSVCLCCSFRLAALDRRLPHQASAEQVPGRVPQRARPHHPLDPFGPAAQ